MRNNHIKKYLNYYINEVKNPQYAILLKGKWGSGKTHFINEYKKSLDENKQKYIYVSLYGITSYDEIETKFLEVIHPVLYSKKTIFAAKIAKQLLKGSLRIDIDNDNKDDVNVSIGIPDIKPEDLLNTKEYTLIFDDLERCNINIINLLGYINFFVEHQAYKVILIANEEKFKDTIGYLEIKEKLIGKTFEFTTNPILAYDSFLNELKNTNEIIENILKIQKSNILELFEKSDFNNLRVLRQTLLDFERFYDEVLINHKENKELINDFLSWFFIFSFEIRQGNNCILDLQKISEEYYLLYMDNQEEEAEKTKFKVFLNKYNLDARFDVIISFDLWKEILFNSKINKEYIDLELKNSKYYSIEQTNSWKLLYSFYYLDDNRFKELVNDIYFKISNNYYKMIDEVKMVSSILLYLQENNLFKKDIYCLEYEIKKQIDFIFDKNLADIESILRNEKLSIEKYQYQNYEFRKSSKIEEINVYIEEKIKNALENKMIEDAPLIIDYIEHKNTKDLLILFGVNIDEAKQLINYRKKPILLHIEVDELFNALIKADYETIYNFGLIIKTRYQNKFEELKEEKNFLEQLLGKIDDYCMNNKYKINSYLLEKYLKNNISGAINKY
ncbi:P-loop NTPase fold protein [Aliarcobacter sp. ERUVET-8]|uniref:P-loop NTPase fold protein n=1 Tax=Aliarcobacter sp. ERUVET-8 TaxID=3429684 RepID=UPI003D6A5F38